MIDRVPHLGRPAFRRSYHRTRPVVITGGAAKWPAAQWTPEFFREACGDTLVTARAHRRDGGAFLEQVITQTRTLSLREFIDAIAPTAPTSETYAWALRESHEILSQHPGLMADLAFDSVLGPPSVPYRLFLWLGPPSYVTGFHTDEIDVNLLAHLYGRKTVTLISPEHDGAMGAITQQPLYDAHYSSIDAFIDQLDVPHHDVELEPGDLLYIPAGWWHRVVGHTVCISASGMSKRL